MRRDEAQFMHEAGQGLSPKAPNTELEQRSVETPKGLEMKERAELREGVRVLLEDWEARPDDWMKTETYTQAGEYAVKRNNKFRTTWLAAVRGNAEHILEKFPSLPQRVEIQNLIAKINTYIQEVKAEGQHSFNQAVAEQLKKTELCTRYNICDSKPLGALAALFAKDETGVAAAGLAMDLSPQIQAAFATTTVEHQILGPRTLPGPKLVGFISSCYAGLDIDGLKKQYLSTPREAVDTGDALLHMLLNSLDSLEASPEQKPDLQVAA